MHAPKITLLQTLDWVATITVREAEISERLFHNMESKTLGARVLEKSIDLLYSFESHRPEQSLFQISRNLGFPPSTVRRLLKVMMSRRLIQQDTSTKLYRLGPGLFYLASVARDGLAIRKIALPFMERLRDLTGENAVLHELRDGKRVCIEKVESTEVLRDSLRVGDQFPAHAGASGKVLLAYLPLEKARVYLKSGHALTALTPRTITDPKKLIAELARIKKRGFAFSCGERVMDGLCAISAPIFDSEGRVSNSLTITLTPFRLQAKGRAKLVELVRKFAAEISLKLGSAAGEGATRSIGAVRVNSGASS
jgi:DNA-binding IclR family transcriptional regulator